MNSDHCMIQPFWKDNSLKVNKGNFNAWMKLTGHAWNVKIDKVIYANASLGCPSWQFSHRQNMIPWWKKMRITFFRTQSNVTCVNTFIETKNGRVKIMYDNTTDIICVHEMCNSHYIWNGLSKKKQKVIASK